MHKEFYQDQNIGSAWGENMSTFFSTNNNFIAERYKEMLVPLIEQAELPVNIIELGAGQGRFAFQLMRFLEQHFLANVRFDYILSDISPNSLQAWKKHPKMQTFIDKGMLDFAIFDLNNREGVILDSGIALSKKLDNCCNIVISNYALSDLAGDLFNVQDGQLFECLLRYDKSLESVSAQELLKALKEAEIQFRLNPIDSDYYPEADINEVLRYYRDNFNKATFDIPYDVIRTFDFFKQYSAEFYWFITDEAHSQPNYFKNRNPRLHRLSTGLFSNEINLHAVQKYILNHQFDVVSRTAPDPVFDTYILVAQDSARKDFLSTAIEQFNSNEFLQIYHGIESQADIEPGTLLAFISLSRFDPGIVQKFRNQLLQLSGKKKAFYRNSLRQSLIKIWECYFDIGEKYDLAYDLGRMFRRLGEYPLAIECFSYSIYKYGNYPASCYNLGRCYQSVQNHQQAAEQLQIAHDLRPQHKNTITALNRSLNFLKGYI